MDITTQETTSSNTSPCGGGSSSCGSQEAPLSKDPRSANHPCFSAKAHGTHSRAHLPVAPRCNLQCNFCNRKFDCMNESRPGVTSAVLPPSQVVPYLDEVVAQVPNLSVVGIAGPGDPFANPVETMETLFSVRKRFPEMLLCVATNGLAVLPHVDNLAALDVSHVTLTINAVNPEIGARIYSWIRDGRRPMRGLDGAKLLLDRQLEALAAMKAKGIVVKVNTILMPGINDMHITEVAKTVAGLGADMMNVMGLVPVKGAAFEDLAPPDSLAMARARLQSGQFLNQMTHCSRCRADAVGLISQGIDEEGMARLNRFAHPRLLHGKVRNRIAVASEEGALVNLHLGEASRIMIFEQSTDTASGFKFVGFRQAPDPGSGEFRWRDLASMLYDCRAFLVTAAGPKPKSILEEHGIEVLEMEGMIEEGLAAVYSDQPIPAALKKRFTSCGAGGCKGTGTGCS